MQQELTCEVVFICVVHGCVHLTWTVHEPLCILFNFAFSAKMKISFGKLFSAMQNLLIFKLPET